MKKYNVYKENIDFIVDETVKNLTGSRTKKLALVGKNKLKAMLKYNKYEGCTELASEKLSYEIAKFLNLKCARVELAKDSNNVPAILNYYFLNDIDEHMDALYFLRKLGDNRKEYLKLDNIILAINSINKEMLVDFLKIMVFDSLVGEQDRHEENWGITSTGKGVELSPIYDNGCNLLRDQYANLDQFLNNHFKMINYINRSTCFIYNNNGKKYKHFDLIDELLLRFHSEMKTIIKSFERLSDSCIENIVNAVPDEYLTDKHKLCIILFIEERRNILLSKIEGE